MSRRFQWEQDRWKTVTGQNRTRMLRRQAKKAGIAYPLYAKFNRIRKEIAEQRAMANEILLVHRAEQRAKQKDRPAEEIRLERNAKARAAYATDSTTWYMAAYARRARIKRSPRIERINRLEVFERDNWRCRICGKKVRDDLPRGHPRKATLAHIVALKTGGDHSLANVCCLCHKCNSRDGINRVPIQFHLSEVR